MKIYNCIAIQTGICKPHTLYIPEEDKRIHIDYYNNYSNFNHILRGGYTIAGKAIDNKGNTYLLYKNDRYIFALKNEYIKPLTIAEWIKKYNLNYTEKQIKTIFNIE